ncbi:hypothetical protein ACHAXH_008660 [Discostella pseudostelligera]
MGKRKRRAELTMSGEESGRSNRRGGREGRGGRRLYYGGRHAHRNAVMQMQPQFSNPVIDVDFLPYSAVTNTVAMSTTSLHNNPLIDATALPATVAAPNVVSATTSRASSTITMDSETAPTFASSANNYITYILPWPNPFLHYIPISEEERLLPTLIRWGKKERGMMRDQPDFRLPQLNRMLENQRISLLQSLSLRRHHLKLLNPNLRMPNLRLGSEDNINAAAEIFERSVDSYLRRHNVEFWTEKEQQRIHVRSNRYEKQPPTPDFRMKNGHAVVLDLSSCEEGGDVHNRSSNSNFGNSDINSNLSTSSTINTTNSSTSNRPIITTIHWIEAKMFYGASTIPHDTPNAVGTILSKVKQYVALYGHGALVFMYGCGDQLARQLADVGVLALDGRCLDLEEVVRHQKRWCADANGNILF